MTVQIRDREHRTYLVKVKVAALLSPVQGWPLQSEPAMIAITPLALEKT